MIEPFLEVLDDYLSYFFFPFFFFSFFFSIFGLRLLFPLTCVCGFYVCVFVCVVWSSLRRSFMVWMIWFLSFSPWVSFFILLILLDSSVSFRMFFIHFSKSWRLKWKFIDWMSMVCIVLLKSVRLVATLSVGCPSSLKKWNPSW